MKVQSSAQIYNRSLYNPYFTSNNRHVYNSASKVFQDLVYRNNSEFFRDDLKWDVLGDTLIDKYAKFDKANLSCYACSEGAEPFSIAMILIEKMGKDAAKKFFPILASDIDPKILENPKAGIIKLSQNDIENIKKFMGDSYSKYIEFDNIFKFDPELSEIVCSGKIKPILKDTVVFKQADIREEIPNIEKKDNSVMLCRNFWPYLKDYNTQRQLIKGIYDKLGDNSLCIIGSDFDGYDTAIAFREVGFYEPKVSYWFEKKPENKKHFYFPHFHKGNSLNTNRIA